MVLLVIWVAALQIMLDEGKDKDWFSSMEIRVLAIIARDRLSGVPDLGADRGESDRGSARVPPSRLLLLHVRARLAFGAFFGLNVLTPHWLQCNMGYTTTWAGMVVAWGGVLSVVFSPIAAKLANKIDPRLLIFIGCALARAGHLLALDGRPPTWAIGRSACRCSSWASACRMYYVPLTGLAMGSVKEEETASAAGLHELRAHDIRRLRHLAGHDLLAESQHPRPCRVGERGRERRSNAPAAAGDQSAVRPGDPQHPR